jgi:hypothetical protein
MEYDHDYRKWIVFNSSLSDNRNVHDLFRAVGEGCMVGASRCEKISENGIDYYLISDTSYSSCLQLALDEKEAFLAYLKKHYLVTEDLTKGYLHNDEEKEANPGSSEGYVEGRAGIRRNDEQKKYLEVFRPYFFNKDITMHVKGYAAVTIVAMQSILIPTNVFHFKSNDFFRWVFTLFFGFMAHVAVRNYKKHFLMGGIRYGMVWKITFWMYLMVCIVIGFELSCIDFFTMDNMDAFKFFGMMILVILAGLLSGWLLSFLIYFINGGKIITDPNAVKYQK